MTDSSQTQIPAKGAPSSAKAPIRTRLRWHESWIVRAAASVAFILFCGYSTSIFIVVQGIDSISRIAYRDDVERVLEDHLHLIKEEHRLRQEIATNRLETVIDPNKRLNRNESVSLIDVRRWLSKAQLEEVFGVEALDVRELPPDQVPGNVDTPASITEWVGPQKLRVFEYVIEVPKGETYKRFKDVEDLRQTYQLVGAKLDDEIQPAMVKANALVLLLTFLLLAVIFMVLTKRFKVKIENIINGFSRWSESDSGFRFGGKWTGELKLITSQFNAMADEVEENRQRRMFLEKLASWQTIARKLAHEIKNPLTPIQMMVSQVARRYKGDDEDFRKLLNNAQEVIVEEVSGLRRMVDNFSQFARLPVPQPKPDNVVPLLARVVELQRAAFEKHDILFKAEEDHISAMVDGDLIRQVIINLIKNAAEASATDPATIAVSARQSDRWVYIEVADNGPGIPAELQSRIFEAYFTTKHTGPSPGMGLGLAVCQKIVIDHGGEMRVRSQPGDTRFQLKLPRIKEL